MAESEVSLRATIVGILGGVPILVVIFGLLTLARRGEVHLDQMGPREAKLAGKPPAGLEESLAKSPRKMPGSVHVL